MTLRAQAVDDVTRACAQGPGGVRRRPFQEVVSSVLIGYSTPFPMVRGQLRRGLPNKRAHLVMFGLKGRPEGLFSDLKTDTSALSDTSTLESRLGTE